MDDMHESEAGDRLGRLWFSDIWKAKIQSINDYLEQPDWDHMTFLGRLMSYRPWRLRKVDAESNGGYESSI